MEPAQAVSQGGVKHSEESTLPSSAYMNSQLASDYQGRTHMLLLLREREHGQFALRLLATDGCRNVEISTHNLRMIGQTLFWCNTQEPLKPQFAPQTVCKVRMMSCRIIKTSMREFYISGFWQGNFTSAATTATTTAAGAESNVDHERCYRKNMNCHGAKAWISAQVQFVEVSGRKHGLLCEHQIFLHSSMTGRRQPPILDLSQSSNVESPLPSAFLSLCGLLIFVVV